MRLKLLLIFLASILLASFVNAVETQVTSEHHRYDPDQNAIFYARFIIEENERIPIRYLSLKIDDKEECRFDVNSSILGNCENIEIRKISDNTNFDYGLNYGYGYGYDGINYSEKNVTFGFGNGYSQGKLEYEIKWDLENEVILEEKNYNYKLKVYAELNNISFGYLSEEDYIHIEEKTRRNQVNIKIIENEAHAKIYLDGFEFNEYFTASTEEDAINYILNNTNLTLENVDNIEIYRLEKLNKDGEGRLGIRIKHDKSKIFFSIDNNKDAFTLETSNREEIMNEVYNRTNLTLDDIDNLTQFSLRIKREVEDVITTPPSSGNPDSGGGGGVPWYPAPEPIVLEPVPFNYPDCKTNDDCNENEICVFTFSGYYKQCISQESETLPVLSTQSSLEESQSQPQDQLTGLTILNNIDKNLAAGIIITLIVILLIIAGYLYLNKK